ncbi:MAG: hypothetical protein ACRYG2_22345 [Janthinobacterium lividum]
MRKVILSSGLVLGVIALAVGIFGLATTPYDHVVPVPYRIISFGVVSMMGTLLILVVTFAHGTRAGDFD